MIFKKYTGVHFGLYNFNAMDTNKIKTIFIGTSGFGLPALRRLTQSGLFELAAVITQPDKPAGRKMKTVSSPVKTEALKYRLPVMQPPKIGEIADKIAALSPAIIVVAAYGQILAETILNIPKYGCINLHASLLPKYRGAACIQAAIMSGDDKTGVTIMKMDKGLDTGPILAQKSLSVAEDDTAGTLHDRLSQLAAEMLEPAIKSYISGEITPLPQKQDEATYAKGLTKRDGKIDWSRPAAEIARFIRAMNPWPGAFSFLGAEKKTLKIIRAREILAINDRQPGKLFLTDKKLAAQCGRDSLVIEQLQLSGKKIMSSREFLNGYGKYADTELK
jgi:methionyl-tRNA formyltransferase